MKKKLENIKDQKSLYHYVNGKKIEGKNKKMRGDCTGLYGDCTELKGNCALLKGDCTWLIGDCTWLRGDLDDCEITEEERMKGIYIQDLVKRYIFKI